MAEATGNQYNRNHMPKQKLGTSILQEKNVVKNCTIKKVEYKQLKLWESPQSTPEAEYPLHTEPLPPTLQLWGEERFWLIHTASGLRVPGTWTSDEVGLILDLSRNWNWSVDRDRRVACGIQLIALAEAVCKRSSVKRGER